MDSKQESRRQPSYLNKIWYLFIDDLQEGPYSYLELSGDDRLTLETLAWRKGMADWLPIAQIDELKHLFEREKEGYEKEEKKLEESAPISDEELVLDLPNGGPSPIIWIILILLIIFYTLYEYFWLQ